VSNAATSWARKQRTGDSRTSYVLRDLADRANSKGEAWSSVQKIAEDTEQSLSSVKRCLVRLQQQNLIARLDQTHYDDSGKWSSTVTIVLYNEVARKNAVRRGWLRSSRETNGNICDIIDETAPENQSRANDGGSIRATDRSSHWTTDDNAADGSDWTTDRGSLVSHENHNLRTITPKVPVTAQVADRCDDRRATGEWKRFQDAWPWRNGEAVEPIKRHFEAMRSDRNVSTTMRQPVC
jgi:hypothetical protein